MPTPARRPGFETIYASACERKAQDPRIIRNHRKVLAIRENAGMIAATRRQYQCDFGQFVLGWPETDTVGLWQYLKKNGSRLGGNTGPYALRALGVDTLRSFEVTTQ